VKSAGTKVNLLRKVNELTESIKNWLGKWEDDEGYWLNISELDGEILLKRSGNIGSQLNLTNISDDSSVLIYEETGKDINIRHTLTLKSKCLISDNLYLLDEKMNWQTNELRHSSNSKASEHNIKLIDQGKASSAIFEDSTFDEKQSDFLRRLMHGIRESLLEEVNSNSAFKVKLSTEDVSMISENIGFTITSVLDGCDVIGDSKTPMPHLAFRENGKIVTNKSGSYLHEMVSGYFDDEEFED
jgi:hypothetical protein